MIVITENEVEELSNWKEGIEINEQVFLKEALELTNCPTRILIDQYRDNSAEKKEKRMTTYFKPCLVDSEGIGLKVVSVVPDNVKINQPTVPATIFLIDPNTGLPLSVIGATYLTGFRTAAGSAVALRYLTGEDEPKVLAVLGSGLQARCHIEAVLVEKPSVKTVKINSRTKDNVLSLISKLSPKYSGVSFEYVEDADEIVKDADVIVTATASSTPVVKGKSLKDGAIVIAVGSARPDARELDQDTTSRSSVIIVDDPSSCKVSGDIIQAINENIIKEKDLIRLSQVVKDKGVNQSNPDTKEKSIKIYKSAGTSIQDISTGMLIYKKALELNKGTKINM